MAQDKREIPLRERKNLHYRSIFNRYDRDNDGFINVGELTQLIESREYGHDIPGHVVRKIHQMSDQDATQRIDFNEFMDMINNLDLQYVFRRFVNCFANIMMPKRPQKTETDGLYEEQYTCYPPAVGIIIISILQVIFFCVDEALEAGSTITATGPFSSTFIFDGNKREEIWRFITYMFVNDGTSNFFYTLCFQILLGIPLEMVHKWWRVLPIYFAGVLASSLAISILRPLDRLDGAGGGFYSLLTAYLVTLVMNRNKRWVELFLVPLVTATQVGPAIYERYVLQMDENIPDAAKLAAALAGLLVSLSILRNLEVTKVERVDWYASIKSFLKNRVLYFGKQAQPPY